MNFNVYSIKDKLIGFGQLILESSDAGATRYFAYALNTGMSAFAKSDMDLYQVGTYNLESGQLEGLPVPKFIINGVEASKIYSFGGSAE